MTANDQCVEKAEFSAIRKSVARTGHVKHRMSISSCVGLYIKCIVFESALKVLCTREYKLISLSCIFQHERDVILPQKPYILGNS